MFHPHFFHLFFGTPDCSNADTMALAAAFKVEMDLQRDRREDREKQERSNCSEYRADKFEKVKPKVYRG